MQPHKNSTPLGIHTRRCISRPVASMRYSATTLKKMGKQKLHPPGTSIASRFSLEEYLRLFHALLNERPQGELHVTECTVRMHFRTRKPCQSSRSKTELPTTGFKAQTLESDTTVFTLCMTVLQYERNVQKTSCNRNYFWKMQKLCLHLFNGINNIIY